MRRNGVIREVLSKMPRGGSCRNGERVKNREGGIMVIRRERWRKGQSFNRV